MSARACPKCRRELPETTLRALAQGAPCPFCATPLKTKPRRAPEMGPADQEYAAFELSTTPPPVPPPQRSSGAAPSPLPGVTAPRAMPPAPVGAPPAPAPRPAPAAAPPPVERRPAPTMVGIAPPPPEKASPPARAPSPVVQPAPAPSPPVVQPAPTPAPIVQAAPARQQPAPARQQPAPERPSVPLAMSAALPAAGPTGTSFALAMPGMALPPRSRRNLAIAGGAAALVVAVAILVLHHPSADRLPVESAPPAITKPTVGAGTLATPEEKSPAAPKIEPMHSGTEAVAAAKVEAAGDAPASATEAAPAKVRGAHHATAHKRHAKHERYAKRERHEKHARHEKRTPRRLEAAAEPAPSPAAEGDARATYQKGNALLFAGDAAGAVSAYKKAVELAPKDPIGYRGLGLAYEQQGATKPAIRALRKYLKLAPGAADREIISRRIARLAGAAH
jgi:hypothetical protein